MEVVDLPFDSLEDAMLARLRESIRRYGRVENPVVRLTGRDTYEVLSGNQRLKILAEMGVATAPRVIVKVNDAQARLLAQVLNRCRGEDDLGLKAELVRNLLGAIPVDEVVALLPETAYGLQNLASLGEESLDTRLDAWQAAQAVRLRHLQFQLTDAQLEVVEQILARILPLAKAVQGDSPNLRGSALYLLCSWYLEHEGERQ